jgi:hypothetical protein
MRSRKADELCVVIVFADAADTAFVGGAVEQFTHFFVGGLRKVLVPSADGMEGFGSASAHDLFDFGAELIAGVARANGHRHGYGGGMAQAQRADGGAHARAGGEAVVDENNGVVFEVGGRAVTAIGFFTSAQFFLLFADGGLDPTFGHAEVLDDFLIKDAHAAGSDGTHGQFFIAWRAQFADDKDIERSAESASDFKGDGHTAAREGEHNDIGLAGVMHQLPGQESASVESILKACHRVLCGTAWK